MHIQGSIVTGAAAIALAFASTVSASVISGNFCSVAPIANFPAGVVPVGGWNDYTLPAGYAPSATVQGGVSLFYDDGSPVAASTFISWDVPNGGSQNTNDDVQRPISPNTTGADIDDGHDQMMTGYLQASRFAPAFLTPMITLSGTGLNAAFASSYSLILYIDGDADVQPSPLVPDANNQYKVTVWADATKTVQLSTTVFGRDTDEFAVVHTVPNSLADYVPVTSTISGSPTAGNYVMISGLSSDSFYVEIEGVAAGTNGLSNNGGHGVALNGFQIIPEPASLALLAVGGLLILNRNRRA